MKIGYARVSTQDQSFEAQVEQLTKAGCEKIFSEKMSGKSRKRPELDTLLDFIRAGDVLVVTKLDRLARSLSDLVFIMEKLNTSEASFLSLSENFDLSTSAGRMQMQMIGVFAEFERSLIAERTSAGLERARAMGRIGGRKKALTPAKEKELIAMCERGEHTQDEVAHIFGVSTPTVKRTLKRHREAQD